MPVEEQVVVDLRRHQRLPRRHPGRRRAALRGRAARVRSAPATARPARRRSATTGTLPDGDALDAVADVQGRASQPTASTPARRPHGHRRRRARRGRDRRDAGDGVAAWPVARSASCGDGSERPVDEEDHARDGADRGAAASSRRRQRVHAAVPYSEQITEVVRDLAAAGAGARPARCSTPRDRDPHGRATSSIAADRGLCGGYNSGGHPRRRGRDQAPTQPRARDYALDRRRHARPRATSASAATRIDAVVHRLLRPARPTRTPRRSPQPSSRLFDRRRGRPRRDRLHPVHLAPACQEVVQPAAHAARARASRRRRPAQPTSRRPRRDYEFEPDPDDDPRRAAAPLRRGPHLRRPARTPRRPSTPPASGP